MIDLDVNDQFTPQIPQPEKNKSKGITLLVVVIAFVIYAGVWALISIPKIKDAVKQTKFVEIVSNFDKYRDISDTREYSLFFVTADKSCIETKRSVPVTGVSVYHDVIEGLLKGPDNDALKSGAVTCIPQGTRLNGFSISNGYAFVDFSEEFLAGEYEWVEDYVTLAKNQLLSTLKCVDSTISVIIILIDGTELA